MLYYQNTLGKKQRQQQRGEICVLTETFVSVFAAICGACLGRDGRKEWKEADGRDALLHK